MSWTRSRDTETMVEWERQDAMVTIRCRQRPDESWVIRLDVLEQAPEPAEYRSTTASSYSDAAALAESWRSEFG
jgi:hypothetical protein